LPKLLRKSWYDPDKPLEIVYVLRCKNGKYYVGKTEASRLNTRQAEHLAGDCWWTRQHPPLEVVEEVPCGGFPFLELAMTYHYMNLHGTENVRGAQHCGYLDDAQTEQIQRALRHENNLCLGCGSPDHWISKCPYEKKGKVGSIDDVSSVPPSKHVKQEKEKEKIIDLTSTTDDAEPTVTTSFVNSNAPVRNNKEKKSFAKKEGACFNCGAEGHWMKDCQLPRKSFKSTGAAKTFVKKK
jgi:hypothetical protein